MDPVQTNIDGKTVTLSNPHETDALSVKRLVDKQSPNALYAAYYFAMNFLFNPFTSVIAKDDSGETLGAAVGMYDFKFKTLILSHITTALELTAENAKQLKNDIVMTAFEQAAKRGAKEVSAHLDIDEDQDIVDAVINAAGTFGLTTTLSFNGSDDREQQRIETPVGLDTDKIEYRHPTEDDARALWSLVLKIGEESGGLDRYALSNFERLCRDTPETTMLAVIDGHIVGFATGFAMNNDEGKKGLFMWQTGIHPAYGRKGIGSKVEIELIDSFQPEYLHFTVEASNPSANKTAVGKSKYLNMPYDNPGAIESETISVDPAHPHEAEVIYTVAPDGYAPALQR